MEKEEKNHIYQIAKVIYTVLLKMLYHPKVYGAQNIPKDEGIIFAGNHRHAFDPIVVMSETERIVHYMAKEEIFKGLHGRILKKMGIIKIYRTKRNKEAILEAEKILNEGGTVGIFPEGTRNRTERELLKFKNGAVTIAKNTNCKILPFAIKGEYKIFRKELVIEFGKPIDVSQMEKQEANDYLKSEILNLLRNNRSRNEECIYY